MTEELLTIILDKLKEIDLERQITAYIGESEPVFIQHTNPWRFYGGRLIVERSLSTSEALDLSY